MGVIIPQVVTSDKASGAQVFDGSLRFDKETRLHLIRTPGSSGNQKTWTLSFWFKKQNIGDQRILFNSFTDNSNRVIVRFMSDKLQFALQTGGTFYGLQTNQVFRDNGWYHVVLVLDTTQNNESSRQRIYVNGNKIADGDLTHNSISGTNKYPTKDATFNTNTTVAHYIGANNESGSVQDTTFDGQISNAYLIDGLAIAPAFFGYTDPLTNVWRPRGKLKKTVNDGTDFTADITNTGATLSNPGRIFDGTIDSDATIASGAATITYTPSTPIKYTDSVRVMGSGSPSNPYNARWQLNGGSNVSTVNANEFVTLDEGNGGGTITSIKLTVDSGGANWRAIQVDGVIMKASSVTSIEFGTNGYYLPFDGNTKIGEDRSGKGNDWRAVNFGGSTDITKATGAKPILNTLGGNIARPGVFGSDVGAYYHTTSGSNSGGKYVFEDQGTQPTFSFIRGATYVFDWSASTSHPLRFSTTTQEGGGTATPYTKGTVVVDSAPNHTTTITVPHDAPDTLYYYCNVHPGMGNSISVTTDITKADPYASNCVLAMPLVGFSTDVSASIACTSTTKSITSNGNPGAGHTEYNFYGGSFEFDGTDDCLTSSDCGSGATQYTMECWLNTDGFSQSQRPINMSQDLNGNRYLYAEITTAKKLQIREESTGSAVSADAVFRANKWHHLAVSYDGSRLRGFVDGVLVVQTAAGSTVASGNNMKMRVGADESNPSSNEFDGHIQDVRVYFGACKYTATNIGDQAFIPASAKPDILPDSPSGVAVKSKLTEITEGSVSFDGISGTDGDYLATYTSSSELSFGTGDFTIEMFLYNEETAGKGFIQFSDTEGGFKTSNSGTITIHKEAGQSGVFRAYAKNSSTAFSTPVPFKRWCHVALVRESGTVKLFVDGKQDATTISSDTTNYATTYVVIGGYYDTDYLSKCSISNVRVNKGTAVYTRDFKPPTRQLTNISGTKLLCCHSNSQPGAGITAPNMGGVNSGVQWSAGAGPNFEAANPARDGFNGKINSNTRTDNSDVTATVNFPVPVAFSSTLKVRGARDSGNGKIILIGGNGQVDVSSQFTSSSASLETVTITGVTSPLKGISLIGISGSAQPRFSAIYIDDVMLVDPLTPNGDVSVSSNAEEKSSAATFNPFNTDINTVRGQEGSYVTLNPIDPRSYTDGPTYTFQNGNLTAYMVGGNANASKDRGLVASTIDFPNGGKWYCEINTVNMDNNDISLGIASDIVKGYYETGSNAKPGAYLLRQNGIFYHPTGQLGSSSSRQYDSGDLIGLAVDLVDPKITFYKNGRILYVHSVDLGQGPFKVAAGTDAGSSSGYTYTFDFNFGQKPFKFSPPDGFQPLTSTLLRPETVIVRPDQYVGVSTYVGNGASSPGGSGGTQSINVGFKPDLIWIKDRTQAHNNNLIDSVNGAPNLLMSDLSNTLDTTSTDGVTAITDTGFTLGDNGAGTQSLEMNKSGNNYVAWTWKAGGNKGTFNQDDVGYSSASSVGMNIGGKNGEAYITGTYTSKWDAAGSTGAVDNGERAFNGNKSNYASCQNSSTKTIWRPDTPIKVNKSLRVYASGINSGNNQVFVNGTSLGSVTNSAVWYTVNAAYLTEIALADVGSTHGRLWAVEVDGRLLLDSAQTPTDNFPTIASTGCSVGTKQGFGIVRYTGNSTGGATVAHGLLQTPDLVIVKQISGTSESWRVRHSHMADLSKTLYLNQNVAETSNTEYISDAGAATITLSTGANGINSGSNFIVYSWHDVPGLQKFGKWTNNNTSNGGTFIELGFKPALILFKNSDSTENWYIIDSTRHPYNQPAPSSNAAGAVNTLNPDTNHTEATSRGGHTNTTVDILSNGFKIRTTNSGSGEISYGTRNYVYAAWAEAPAYNLFGAQSNAR